MENGKPSSASSTGTSNKISSTKAKAAGALRVFLNFLQKPARKRNDEHSQSQDGNSNDNVSTSGSDSASTTRQSLEKDPPVVPQRRNAFRSNWNRFKIWSYPGSDSTAKSDLSSKLEVKFSEIKGNIDDIEEDVDCDARIDNEIDDNLDNNVDVDDEVFFNDSYFEDDYTDDFSGDNSCSNSRDDVDIYRCCDVPESLFDDAFNDCMDVFDPYHDNLNLLENIVKDYNKIIPESITTATKAVGFPYTTTDTVAMKDDPRYRRHSTPYDFPLVDSPTSTPNLYPDCKNLATNLDPNTLPCHSTPSDTKAGIKTTRSTHDSNFYTSSDDVYTTPLQTKYISKTNVLNSTYYENVPYDQSKINPDYIPSMNLESHRNLTTSATESFKSFSNTTKHFDSPFESKIKSAFIERFQELHSLDEKSNLTYSRNMAPMPSPPATMYTRSKMAVPIIDDLKMETNVNGRRSSSGSVESGYVTSGRVSSASTPFSPLYNHGMLLPDPYAASLPNPYAPSIPDPYAPSIPDPYAASLPDLYAPLIPDPYAASLPNPYSPSIPDPYATVHPSSFYATPPSIFFATPQPNPHATPLSNLPRTERITTSPKSKKRESPWRHHPYKETFCAPLKPNGVTPLTKLHSGIPLSPHSRNTLDGIITPTSTPNNPRQAPRRTLKRKFIFPSIATTTPTLTPSKKTSIGANDAIAPEIELKTVIETVESNSISNESKTFKSAFSKPDGKSCKFNDKTSANLSNQGDSLSAMSRTKGDFCNGGDSSAKVALQCNQVNTIARDDDDDDDELVSIVELQRSKNVPEGELQPGSLSCLPLSPTPPPSLSPPTNPDPLMQQRLFTPIEASHQTTPSRRPQTMAYYLNDVVLTSPFGKTLRPICTSSPIPNKFAPNSRRHSTTAATMDAANTDITISKSVLRKSTFLECSPVMPVQIHCSKSASPLRRVNKMENNDNNIIIASGKVQKSNSERRKKLVKRKSARARLDFDRKDLTEKLLNGDDSALLTELFAKDVDPFQHAMSGDYVLLKRVAEDIVRKCPSVDLIHMLVDMPALMENLNTQYSKIMKSDKFKSKPITRISQLKEKIQKAKLVLSNLTVENCLDVVFMSLLVRDSGRISASLDFVFENLPRIIQVHSNLYHLAPEVVMLLLSNRRSVVKNNHGFPLSYVQSEKEVLKAAIKYGESMRKNKNPGKSTETRVKNLLSFVTDTSVLTAGGTTSSADKRLLKQSQANTTGGKRCSSNIDGSSAAISEKPSPPPPLPPPPRHAHFMAFTKSSPFSTKAATTTTNRNREHLFQPFISSNIHSLDEIGIAQGATTTTTTTSSSGNQTATHITLTDIANENCVLRKLYFSYRRGCVTNAPVITKIGMQYSHRGKKKSAFIAASRTKDTVIELTDLDNKENYLKIIGNEASVGSRGSSSIVVEKLSDDDGGGDADADAGTTRNTSHDVAAEKTVVKRAAVILKAGEHITAVSVLGQRALHNIEIVTNTGRRIRAHSIQDTPPDARWVAIATPTGNEPFCLHALYGDLHRSTSGRSTIRDVGALWISTATKASIVMNDLD